MILHCFRSFQTSFSDHYCNSATDLNIRRFHCSLDLYDVLSYQTRMKITSMACPDQCEWP